MIRRCPWTGLDPLYQHYHDSEWGVPVHDEHRLFELLLLEGAQAGLAWITVLRKREGYREAFEQFDPVLVASYDLRRIEMLVKNKNIIRNRAKIESAVSNAQAFLRVQAEHTTFDDYIWQFIGGHPKQNRWRTPETVPSQTPESQAMSKDLHARGFRFTGPTICYAFMQAAGMVNDHLVDCDRYEALARPQSPSA